MKIEKAGRAQFALKVENLRMRRTMRPPPMVMRIGIAAGDCLRHARLKLEV
jgi:hypothetical protein